MNKVIYSFLLAFSWAFLSAFTYFNWDLNPRIPASLNSPQDPILDLAPNQQTTTDNSALSQKVMAEIDAIYNQAITNDNNYAKMAAAYDALLQQSIAARQTQVTANPNNFMFPGNTFDSQYSRFSTASMAISRDRQFNLVFSSAKMKLLKEKYGNLLTAEQKFDVEQKQMQLTTLVYTGGNQNLYTWPLQNDPLLLGATTTSQLGVQQTPLVPTYDPLTGIYSSSPVPGNSDIPVTGVVQDTTPQSEVIDPVLDSPSITQ